MQKKIYDGKQEGLYEDMLLHRFLIERLGGLFVICKEELEGAHVTLVHRDSVYYLNSCHVTALINSIFLSPHNIHTYAEFEPRLSLRLFGEEQRISEVERIIEEEAEKHKPKSIEATVGG